MPRRRRHRWLIVLGSFVVLIAILAAVWDWNWFRPLVQSRASAALGRPVTIGRFDVTLGRMTTITLDNVRIDNPPGFPPAPPVARIHRLAVSVNLPRYIHGRQLVIPRIELDHPDFDIIRMASGADNWTFPSSGNTASKTPPRIGDLVISNGFAHVVDPKVKADLRLAIETHEPEGGNGGQIVVDGAGTYAAQPVSGRFIGGTLLSLRNQTKPYPVDLHLADGKTEISLVGTVRNPATLAGADLKLTLSGPDMARLTPFTGLPTPPTPPFTVTGHLTYDGHGKIGFDDFHGRLGRSDLAGDIDVKPRPGQRPIVDATLSSTHVHLDDLGGFIGAVPGTKSTPGETATQERKLTAAKDRPTLIPDRKVSLPRIKSVDVHLRYTGEHVEGRNVPIDHMRIALDIVNGEITLHPVSFGIGSGHIITNADLKPENGRLHAHADIDFRRVSLAAIMNATHLFTGAGLIGGSGHIDGTGNSLAAILADGNGGLKLDMGHGGDLSALLVALSGLEFGNALLDTLGFPRKTTIRCLVSAFALRDGILDTNYLALDTKEANIYGSGTINFRNQTIDYEIRTKANHFSIGSLPGPIDITGKLKSPRIRPGAATGIRAGIAAALGVVFPPLALLPTIQLGLGSTDDCKRLVESGHR